ncbi:MAG: GNAT family N-acetyltransferase [Lachnospiraceae bacterium]|nr:GNAT family N-acetyltransferase [Lachnospiraceae bacterium]
MIIRRAEQRDIPGLHRLLSQVNLVHHEGRPDLFKVGNKYTDAELETLLSDDARPVFVVTEEGPNGTEQVLAHGFCMVKYHPGDNILTDVRTLYIDDICVEETARGRQIGKALYEHVLAYARSEGFYNVTLNVWCCNEGAMRFYEAMGMHPQKVGMETIL